MSSDLLDGRALSTIVREELEDEVLEVFWQIGAIGFAEVGVGLSIKKQAVEVFLLASFLEGEDALNDDEQDDTNWEHVDLLANVCLSLFDLRSHVGHGSSVRPQSIDVFVTRKSEVGNFEVQIVVNKDVLKFEVAVDNLPIVHVFDWVEHLVEEESSGVFSHLAHGLAEVEKEATLDELHDDVD